MPSVRGSPPSSSPIIHSPSKFNFISISTMVSQDTHYKVFLAEYCRIPENHHAIYIDSHPSDPVSRHGQIFHVIGSLQTGLKFETRTVVFPFDTPGGESIQHIGWILKGDQTAEECFRRVEAVCLTIPPPKKQYNLMKRLYPDEPIRHCQHWIQEAKEALFAANILEPLNPDDDGQVILRETTERGAVAL
ncbi:hypothetical protein B0J18DRAFT_19961 [Chaetomium sp. MPI-SDFR-AT-0129]|nr:hypothetical protein B0J18DRAFT_19961 [Chaetomium sp. MPI-SDFR-AT-0129]